MSEDFIIMPNGVAEQDEPKKQDVIEVLIVEDEPDDRDELLKVIDENPELFRLADYTDDGDEALKKVISLSPDAVILDLELNKGAGDGLEFLKNLQKTDINQPPIIVVATNNISNVVHETARSFGADYIITKTKRDYTANTPFEFLLSVRSTMLSKKPMRKISATEKLSKDEQLERRYLKAICLEMDKIGVSPRLKGYALLIEAILLVIQGKPDKIYSVLAKRHKKTTSAVERAMQNAINKTWNTTDMEILLTHYTARYRTSRGEPTLTEFIHYYANKVQVNY